MKKKKKPVKTIAITFAVMSVLVSALLLQQYYSSVETPPQAPPAPVSDIPDWKTYTSPEGGLTLTSPFPITWDKDEHITNRSGYKTIHGHCPNNGSGFLVSLNYTEFVNSTTNASSYLEETENAVRNIFRTYRKFQWREQITSCSNRPATLANYSYDLVEGRALYTDLLVASPTQFWKVQTTARMKTDNYGEWSRRVMDSVKIEVPKP